MKEPTKKQLKVLGYIRDEIESGHPPPCVREIADHFGYSSTRAACDHLDALERKKCIKRKPGKARSIRIIEDKKADKSPTANVPVVGHIPAGTPVDVEEQRERMLNIDIETLGFQPSDRTFALVVHGDSMVGRGIVDGDTVIADGTREPRNGDMVVALIDNECTLKTLIKQKGKLFLRPENPSYKDLIPVHELLIQGVATTVIRNLT